MTRRPTRTAPGPAPRLGSRVAPGGNVAARSAARDRRGGVGKAIAPDDPDLTAALDDLGLRLAGEPPRARSGPVRLQRREAEVRWRNGAGAIEGVGQQADRITRKLPGLRDPPLRLRSRPAHGRRAGMYPALTGVKGGWLGWPLRSRSGSTADSQFGSTNMGTRSWCGRPVSSTSPVRQRSRTPCGTP